MLPLGLTPPTAGILDEPGHAPIGMGEKDSRNRYLAHMTAQAAFKRYVVTGDRSEKGLAFHGAVMGIPISLV